jgi:hypothetical protein
MHRCIPDKTSPRWANVPVPAQGSLVAFLARCHQVTINCILSATIESIYFCPTVPTTLPPNPYGGSQRGSPNKRRKYNSHASPRVPVPAVPTAVHVVSLPLREHSTENLMQVFLAFFLFSL